MLLIPLPFEVATKAGRRIASRCRESSPGMKDDMYMVLSVSNGYCGYVTTPEEYVQQHYKRGHTLYSPRTCGFPCHPHGKAYC